jgi:hypothetical protein
MTHKKWETFGQHISRVSLNYGSEYKQTPLRIGVCISGIPLAKRCCSKKTEAGQSKTTDIETGNIWTVYFTPGTVPLCRTSNKLYYRYVLEVRNTIGPKKAVEKIFEAGQISAMHIKMGNIWAIYFSPRETPLFGSKTNTTTNRCS